MLSLGLMSRTLLLGRAGAGKTQRVVAAVRAHLDAHDARGRFERFQVLVPTYSQAEHLKRAQHAQARETAKS